MDGGRKTAKSGIKASGLFGMTGSGIVIFRERAG
jgi:hypothetical protein